MNKRAAKKLIKELQDDLRNDPTGEKTVKQQFWMDKVQGYTQTIFGLPKDHIALPMFGTYYNGVDYPRPFNKLEKDKLLELRRKLLEMFEVYQKFIDNKVFLKRNFFSNDTNGSVAAWLIFAAGILWLIAYNLGSNSANFDEARLKYEIATLKKELSDIKHGLPYPKKNQHQNNNNDTVIPCLIK